LGRRRKSVSTEENRAIFRRYIEEVWNQTNLEVVDEIFERYISHQPDGSVLERGPEDVKRFVGEFRTAFPDLRLIIDDQIAEGDKVMIRETARGTHQGELRGLAPTGEEMEIPGMAVFRFAEEGKVVESWDSYDQLSLMRQSIEHELRAARRIQQAMLPQGLPQLDGWQVTRYYRPAREVGGDFYDFFELEDGRMGLAVGDATGKGMPAALAASATGSMLRAVAQDSGDDAEELRARGMPLGLMSGMSYEEGEASLRQEDDVLFYSDGLVEAHDPEGEMFGFPRLHALVAEHAEEERSLGDFLMEELYSFVGEGWEQEDDITLLTLRRSAS
jgi:serine phosphatase RsbU (regulator of sigma subunit)